MHPFNLSSTQTQIEVTPQARRRLMLIQIEHSILAILAVISFILAVTRNQVFFQYYIHIIGIAFLMVTAALYLTRKNHQDIAKHLLYLIVLAIVWLPLYSHPGILNKGLTPLLFSTCIILYSSLFYTALQTFLCALLQIIAGGILIAMNPMLHGMNWHILLIYYVIFSILAVGTSSLLKRDIDQIDHQKYELNTINRELITKEKELYHMAFYDSLTGLGSQHKFSLDIHHLMDQGISFHIVDIDIDHFGFVNETLGHSRGDELLVKIAEILSQYFQEDHLYRWAEDEFFAFCLTEDPNKVRDLLRKVDQRISQCSCSSGTQLSCSISAGIAFHPADGETTDELLKSVSLSLDRAKKSGRNSKVFYTDALQRQLDKDYAIQTQIDASLRADAFTLYLQPIYNLSDKSIHSAEVLLRAPGMPFSLLEIISVAERTNQILAIDQWVLESVFKMLTENPETFEDITLSINLSTSSFRSEVILRHLKNLIETYPVDTSRLELEITEHSLIQDFDSSLATIIALRSLGFKIAIDDFGTKYSSLNYISKLPIDVLKIDKSYIDNITSNHSDRAIVKHLVALTKDLRLTAIAEGIERDSQCEVLESLSCDCGQGFLFARPMPLAEFTHLRQVSDVPITDTIFQDASEVLQ